MMGWWIGVVVGLAAVLLAARPAAAEGGHLGASPWFPHVDADANPQETYDLNTLGVVRLGEEGWRVNRGKYRSLVSRHDFFVTVGRTDLARHDARSDAISSIVFWSGLASVGVGAVLVYAHGTPGGLDPSLQSGLLFGAGGFVGMWISTWFTGATVAPEEAEEMAQRYNEQLQLHIERETGSERRKPMQVRAPTLLLPWTDGLSGGGVMALAVF
jgi:hypothetical protein